MKITAIPVDNFITKDGVHYFTSNDDTFWNSYSTVHAFQIDTDGTSNVELTDGTNRQPTQNEITALENKWNTLNTAETDRITAYNNSWDRVRIERVGELSKTDKYMISDYPITAEKRTEFQNYRTSLRDLPSTYSSEQPSNITFDENGNVSVNGTQVITKPTE